MLYNEIGHNEIEYSKICYGRRYAYSSAVGEGMYPGEHLALDCGLAVANAELAWLSQPSLFVEAVQSGSATLTV